MKEKQKGKRLEDSMETGYVQIYTGNGKGKTTAAFGLALRAALSGKRVFIGQFVKGMEYSELAVKDVISAIEIEQFGRGCFIEKVPVKEDYEAAAKGLARACEILSERHHDLVVLDEIFIALFFKLITIADILALIDKRHPAVELVLTGRYAPQEIIERADLVTEMLEVRHYYSKGVIARRGIEY
ncbi:MAG: cob(I)yrinic acid a,c-diamide adenosyltransferase [Kosmotogaceae bacterium]